MAQGDNCSLFSHGIDLWDLAVMLKLLAGWMLLHCPVGTPAQGNKKKQACRPGSNPGKKVLPWNYSGGAVDWRRLVCKCARQDTL